MQFSLVAADLPLTQGKGGRSCVEKICCSHNLHRVPECECDGAGRQNRNRQRAKSDGRSEIHHLFGNAKDVAFQQCGANAADMNCRGTHDPMRPITNYVRVIDLTAPTSRHTGATNNPAGGGATTAAPGTFFAQVTPQQADVSQAWARLRRVLHHALGFPERRCCEQRDRGQTKVDGNTPF